MKYTLHRKRSTSPTTPLRARLVSGVTALFLLLFAPATYVFADSADPSAPPANPCTPVVTPSQGIQSPTGADSVAYTYNACTGLWESPHYTWNPVTKAYTPKDAVVYTCNISTWRWDYQVWLYSSSRGAYRLVNLSTSTLPSGAVVADGSVNPCAPAVVTNTGPNSDNTLTSTSDSSANIGSTTTTATINNSLDSNSTTGDAAVANNTTAGNATTGNAMAIENLINSVASSSSLNAPGVVTFTANINGDVQGDITIDPSQLQPASSSDTLNSSKINNLTVNTKDSGTINNNIVLAASTGSADVSSNTKAGNATSGNAVAVANVMNTLNSIVSAGHSFVGVININGNFNGNVLVPRNFLDQLLATNAPHTDVTLSADQANSLNLHATTNQTINNAIASSATTGQATVDHNTTAGNATSGNASTKVTVFNLTGSRIMGANSLLVFVNVSGTWVGVIMNAPAGATAAVLGGGINSSSINNNIADIAPVTDQTINNNISLAAASGDASVTNNTTAGNATSGNADTAVNLLNMENSSLNLSGWFGVLFINVFGNWYGSFGILPPTPPANSGNIGQHNTGNSGGTPPLHKVFQFVPASATVPTNSLPMATTAAVITNNGHVLGAFKTTPATTQAVNTHNKFRLIGLGLIILSIVVLVGERVLHLRSANKSA